MKRTLYYFSLLAAFAMMFANNIYAQSGDNYRETTIIDGSDNVISITVGSTGDMTMIPVTLSLSNPTTLLNSLEATLFVPVDVHKFVFDEDDEDFVYEKTSRCVKGHVPTLTAGTEEHGFDGFYISIADSKTRNFKGTEGAIITVYFDGSELADGEYAVQMKDALSVAKGDSIYNSANMDAAFTVVEGVVIGTEGEAPMATGITLSPNSVTLSAIEPASLTADVTPSMASQAVEWTSSDPTVLTVDEEGTIVPRKNGVATISATTTDGSDLTAQCEVTVEVPAIFEVTATTQTTATITANGTAAVADAQVMINDEEYTAADGTVTVGGLAPGETYTATVITTLDDYTWTEELTVQTKDIEVGAIYVTTPTTISITATYDAGDATVTRASFSTTEQMDELNATKLVPATVYTYNFYITTEEGGMKAYPIEVSTKPLKFINPDVNVVKSGEAVVKIESNFAKELEDSYLGDKEAPRIQLEWKKLGEVDSDEPHCSEAYLYDGVIQGKITGLEPVQCEVRPLYEAASGELIYGAWTSFDASVASLYVPTIHTYNPNVEGNIVELVGLSLSGTEDKLHQGFIFWPQPDFAHFSPKYPGATDVQIPSYAQRVIVDGELMKATLTDLQYELEYHYVAFVETTDGEIFYGEERSLFIPDPTGLHSAETTAAIEGNVKVYDLSGSLVFKGNKADMNLNKGIYIVRPAVGKAQKIVVK